MLALAAVALAAFLISLACTPLCRVACHRLGWLDQPGARRVHRTPIPRIGGVAIFLGYAAACGLMRFLPLPATPVAALFPGAILVFGIGLTDDLAGLKPWIKLAGQIAAGLLAYAAGVQIRSIGGLTLPVMAQAPLTVFWLLACTNAFNLIDGLDGLAAGVGLCATLTALLSSAFTGNTALALVTAALAGALVGFLPYNFNPASIFMGDCGSLTLGFLLGCFGVVWSQKSATLVGVTAPLLAFALPLLDAGLAIARRYLRGQAIFGADRRHIHHRLLARGLTTRRVVYLLYAFAGAAAGLSLVVGANRGNLAGPALLLFCALVWIAVDYLGYEEFETARHLLFGGGLRHLIDANVSIGQMEQAIRTAGDLEGCWDALLAGSRSAGFSRASLDLEGRRLSASLTAGDSGECWDVRIPLYGSGYISLSVPFDSPQPPATVSILARSVRSAFLDRIGACHPAGAEEFTADLARLALATGGPVEAPAVGVDLK
jgi:UDP-GlcNAc:undecaprenyl-phosphate GlcNAc-1-phosphate transferase